MTIHRLGTEALGRLDGRREPFSWPRHGDSPLSAIPSSEWKIKQPPPRGSNRIYITVLLMQFLSDFTSVRLVKAQARSVSAARWQRECEPPRTRGAVWMAARSLETMETRAATIARHKKHTPGYEHGHRRM